MICDTFSMSVDASMPYFIAFFGVFGTALILWTVKLFVPSPTISFARTSRFWLMSRGIASSAIHTYNRIRTMGALSWQIELLAASSTVSFRWTFQMLMLVVQVAAPNPVSVNRMSRNMFTRGVCLGELESRRAESSLGWVSGLPQVSSGAPL